MPPPREAKSRVENGINRRFNEGEYQNQLDLPQGQPRDLSLVPKDLKILLSF